MIKHNFGVIKATFTNYLNESENLHAKEQFGKFMTMIKESSTLRTLFEVYRNLEGKYVPNEALSMKYVDENVNKIKASITAEKYVNAINSIQPLMEGLKIKVSPGKKQLFENIDTLLAESLKKHGVDVDKLHESFTFVMEYIKGNKPKLSESTLVGYNQIPKEFLVRKAIEKFNERFAGLNESDKDVFKSIVSSDTTIKQKMFESIKEQTLSALKSLTENGELDHDNLNESIKKLDEMRFSTENYTNDILKLNEFRSDIML